MRAETYGREHRDLLNTSSRGDRHFIRSCTDNSQGIARFIVATAAYDMGHHVGPRRPCQARQDMSSVGVCIRRMLRPWQPPCHSPCPSAGRQAGRDERVWVNIDNTKAAGVGGGEGPQQQSMQASACCSTLAPAGQARQGAHLGDQLRQVRGVVIPVLRLLGHLVDGVVALLRGICLAVLKGVDGRGGLEPGCQLQWAGGQQQSAGHKLAHLGLVP